jgi:dihydropteroate synthase
MGILNVNDDSFFEGSRVQNARMAREKAEKMLADGAAIIDVGAMSSRPGARLIDAHDEWQILQPVLVELMKVAGMVISVDTVWSYTAQRAIDQGVHIINDISAGGLDEGMMSTIGAHRDVPYIMMHMRGKPETMQLQTQYENVVMDVLKYFSHKIRQARDGGIKDIIIDPGFGFAKTKEQSFELLKHLKELQIFDLPVLAGLSRKSMLYKTLNVQAADALNATTVVNTVALINGASILRVHDVKEAAEAIEFYRLLKP